MFYPTSPISFAIEITYSCSNRCPGCANAWRHKQNQTLKEWKLLMDRIAPPDDRKKYAELLRITGGEPTFHNEFFEAIQYLDTFGIPHALFTTGRWSNPNLIVELYKSCQNAVGMLISLHGKNEEMHNAFIGEIPGAFKETCNNVKLAAQSGITVFTNTVITKYNSEHLEQIVDLSQRLGANFAVFNRFLGNQHPLQPTDLQLQKAVCLIENLKENGYPCRIGNCIPKCFIENSSEGSNAGIEHCAISPEGWVRPDNLTNFTFGNIFEIGIEDIWQSINADYYRQQIPTECYECVELTRCRGGEKSVSLEYGLSKDNLIRAPLSYKRTEPLMLNPDFIPIPYFNIRKQPFGFILTRYNWSIPILEEASSIIDSIQKRNDLATIRNRFGKKGLTLIGYLYKEGFIGFQ
jgi:radical SAM protein with 4Fe4S-binding SPASM domain